MADYKNLQDRSSKLYRAVIKINATFRKLEVHDDINCTIEEKYREVKIGERVKCLIYPTQNYFLTTPYYNTITDDGYHCCICINDIELQTF